MMTSENTMDVPALTWRDVIYPDSNGGSETVVLVLDPRQWRVTIETRRRGATGCSGEEHHGIVLAADVRADDGEVDGPALSDFLQSDDGQRLLAAVCAGWDTAWDGHNTVGVLDDDATAAWNELYEWMAHAPGVDGGVWDAGDWLQDVWADDLGITAETTDGELAEIESQIEDEAAADRIVIAGLWDHLIYMRQQLIDDAADDE